MPAITTMIVLDDAFAEADPEIAALMKAALAAMADELPKPQHERISPEGLDAWREGFRVLQSPRNLEGLWRFRHQA